MIIHLAKWLMITGSWRFFSSFCTVLVTDSFHLLVIKTCQFTFGSLHSRDEKPKVILIFSKGWLKNWYLVIHLINFPRIFFSTKLLIFHRSNPGYTRLLLIKRLRYFCFKTKTFGLYSQGKFDAERSVIFLLHSTLDFFFFASKWHILNM